MSNRSEMRTYRASDGTHWGVDVQLPGASNALIVFHHPDGHTARKDRYAWFNWSGPEASKVNGSVDIDTVRRALNDENVRELFTRSMLVGNGRTPSISAA